MCWLLKTKVLTGPFAEQVFSYKRNMINFKAASDLLTMGCDVICVHSSERISLVDDENFVFSINDDDEIDLGTFILKYKDEMFESCEED